MIYSVFKELDFATSLKSGPYRSSNLARAYREALSLARDDHILVDFEKYTPSYESPASFIASPVFDGTERVAIAIFQMPTRISSRHERARRDSVKAVTLSWSEATFCSARTRTPTPSEPSPPAFARGSRSTPSR